MLKEKHEGDAQKEAGSGMNQHSPQPSSRMHCISVELMAPSIAIDE
jgi:hypothetical protein